jgi:hypothetical protein
MPASTSRVRRNLKADPRENINLISDPAYRSRVDAMHAELDRRLIALDAWPDTMPLDEGIVQELPDASIR